MQSSICDDTSILTEILGTISVEYFLEHHYCKLPLARPSACLNVIPADAHNVLDRILRGRPSSVSITRNQGHYLGPIPDSLNSARSLLEQGYTVGIRHAEQSDLELDRLARKFEGVLLAPVDIHLYCTPAGTPGLDWHYDAEEVFVLQVSGEKEWFLRRNSVDPLPLIETIPKDQRYEREVMPLMQCKMGRGDWLYVPGGYWHRTQAVTESISLSVGIKPLTAIDFFDFMRSRLLNSIRWRERFLPPANLADATIDSLAETYQQTVNGLAEDLCTMMKNPCFVRRVVDEQLRIHWKECQTDPARDTMLAPARP